MKTFLVPVDFSETSKNAALYAANFAATIPGAEIILYNVYGKTYFPIGDKDENSRRNVAMNELENLKTSIESLKTGVAGAAKPDITYLAEEGSFISTLEKLVSLNKFDLIVMGITGSSRLTQIFMGTNTLHMIRHGETPVLIVPPEAKYTGIKKVLFTSDFKNVKRTTPFDELTDILNIVNPALHIVNVDNEHYIELTEEYKKERAVLEKKLSAFNPEFSFLRNFDFLDGINLFLETNEIDAIITVPKKHGFLSQLFQTSNTKKLAYHSHVPIFALPI
jgi:Universal stress protein UspA and related nucleotide-binding proteins